MKISCLKKSILLVPGFEPTTFQLMSYCLSLTFLEGICVSLIYHFAPIGSNYSGDLSAVTKTTRMLTSNITKSLHIQ